jgi:hypothetical protein
MARQARPRHHLILEDPLRNPRNGICNFQKCSYLSTTIIKIRRKNKNKNKNKIETPTHLLCLEFKKGI